MRTRFLVVAFCVFGALGAAFAPGCSNQAEGERCSIDNGNSDCESNLECVSVGNGPSGSQFRCCPNPRTSSSSAACRGETTANDATTPTDTGAPGDSGSDADGQTQDSGQDAPVDAPSDSGTDADAAG
ncbi:MSCRAMM family adhesin SdrC [Pendulispora rubella]|uniref:MSCRAMM family adhesin SdrC n=1 Tax=Pendulispora rubella TaxID=2741070 RepID=A0ABZ2LFB3_9BACT